MGYDDGGSPAYFRAQREAEIQLKKSRKITTGVVKTCGLCCPYCARKRDKS